jgi:hypothetical protein
VVTPISSVPQTGLGVLEHQANVLEQSPQVINAVTAALDHFNLVVQAFDKPASFSSNEIVGDRITPVSQCRHFKAISSMPMSSKSGTVVQSTCR